MEVDTSQLKLGVPKMHGLLKMSGTFAPGTTAPEVIKAFKIFLAFNYTVLLKAPP